MRRSDSGEMRPYVRSKVERIKWTPFLHRCFLRAVASLGGPLKATPKLVLQLMDVRGVTLAQIKSHLQVCRSNNCDSTRQDYGSNASKICKEEKQDDLELRLSSTTSSNTSFLHDHGPTTSSAFSSSKRAKFEDKNDQRVGILMVKGGDQKMRLEEERSDLSIITSVSQNYMPDNLQSGSHFLEPKGTMAYAQPGKRAHYRYNSEEVTEKTIFGRSDDDELSLSLSLQHPKSPPLLIQRSSNISSANISEISEQAVSSYSTSSVCWDGHGHHQLNLDLSISLCDN